MTYENDNLLDDLEQIRRREENTLAAIDSISFDNITEHLIEIRANSLATIRAIESIHATSERADRKAAPGE